MFKGTTLKWSNNILIINLSYEIILSKILFKRWYRLWIFLNFDEEDDDQEDMFCPLFMQTFVENEGCVLSYLRIIIEDLNNTKLNKDLKFSLLFSMEKLNKAHNIVDWLKQSTVTSGQKDTIFIEKPYLEFLIIFHLIIVIFIKLIQILNK